MRCKELVRAATLVLILGIAGPMCCWALKGASAAVASDEPKITDVRIRQLIGAPKPKFRIAISGNNLGEDTANTDVVLDSKDPSQPVERRVLSVTPKEVEVEAVAPAGTVINIVKVIVNGKTAEKRDLTISIKPNPPAPMLKTFEIKIDHQQSKEFPNLHSLVITKVSGDPGVGFAANPNRMSIEIEPAGASEMRVVQSNEQQLELRFLAAADYQPKNAIITLYKSSDLDVRKPYAVAKLAPAEPPADPNQPKISNVDIEFINRSEGNGRLRIHGKNFGSYSTSDFGSVDDFLCQCLERTKVNTHRACGSDRRRVHENTCAERLVSWNDWQAEVDAKINAGIVPRNEASRVEKVVILEANDELVDLYFEFNRVKHYAAPFRLASVDLTIKKDIKRVDQTVKAEPVTMTVESSVSKVFSAQQGIGIPRSADLSYRYTVLSRDAAKQLLGEGVADNFYVLQLSVVNSGAKKISIPLAAIQVEVEWARGRDARKDTNSSREPEECNGQHCKKYTDREDEDNESTPVERSYLDGSPTLSPIPLAAVAGYFDAYDKKVGGRAKVFNIFSGITTLATALVPFTGSAVKDGLTILNGGVVPGVRLGWPDLSGQQLQHLTAMSWETTETLAARGGSMEKLVYIQRSAQFEASKVTLAGVPQKTTKQITNVLDLEITGYEVTEAKAQDATPATSPATTPATPAAPSPAASGPSTTTTSSTSSTTGH